jgi:hypothetical protein
MHRLRLLGAAAALGLIAIVAFALVWFQPQKLFIDDRVDEALPAAAASPTAPAAGEAAAPAAAPVRTLSTARFVSHEHATVGRARVIRLADGRRFVRFEAFRTSNGPLLKVYLSAAGPGGPGDAFDDRFVDLGGLKGNVGDQNYAIPRGVDLRAYRSVVVWCKRFGVPFAAAAV